MQQKWKEWKFQYTWQEQIYHIYAVNFSNKIFHVLLFNDNKTNVKISKINFIWAYFSVTWLMQCKELVRYFCQILCVKTIRTIYMKQNMIKWASVLHILTCFPYDKEKSMLKLHTYYILCILLVITCFPLMLCICFL